FKMEFFPGFPLFAITALIHQIPLELQEIPAIAENANSDQHIRFMAPTGKSYITYNFSRPLSIHLTIYDIRGNKLREIMKPASTNGTIFWDRNNSNSQSVSRGIYFYNLKIDKATYRGKFVIVK
ncbi:MAG: T9SS type A sorting domain-containing protein, partial [candidate division WOR-3 bacterium]|nr:T9SS type A sorting domain-containing protein [candidate division WOR-3 bacterium]